MIDDFLATRPLSAHLILIPTTRSAKKSSEAINSIRAYLAQAVESRRPASRTGSGCSPKASSAARVHVISAEMDLCKLPTVYKAASKLVNGDIRDPTGVIADGSPVSIPRLDVVICNAGYGGWSGLDWILLAKQALAEGPSQACTFPLFKAALPSSTLPPQELGGEKSGEVQPQLAEVFTANVFGHYILAHQLLPLLSRAEGAVEPAGRVIWTSSIDAEERHLSLSDIQGFQSKAPYESSKRITDLISVASDLPSVQKASASYFISDDLTPGQQAKKPRFYLTHPGIVCTPLFPLNAVLYFLYNLAMYLCRYLGSPWHTVETYIAACSAVWVALASQEELDSLHAHRVKWGSACDRAGRAAPKKTEVEGWGWEGKVEDAEAIRNDTAEGIQRKLKGRKWSAVELTEEKRAKFEEEAATCWEELEKLRAVWEGLLAPTKKV